MTETRKSRKAALAGQLKNKGKPLQSARQKAKDGLAGSMDALNALYSGKSSAAPEIDADDAVPSAQTAMGSETIAKPSHDAAVNVVTEANKPQDVVKPEATDHVSVTPKAVEATATPAQDTPKAVEATATPAQDTPKAVEITAAPAQDTPKAVEATAAPATEPVATSASSSLKSDAGTIGEHVEAVSYAKDIDEIHSLLSGGKRYFEVNTKDVRGCQDNHRKFGLSFGRYSDLVPPLPENWKQLTGSEYVDQVWSPIILELSDDGELDDNQARKLKETLVDIYDLGYSIETQGVIHPPLGYVHYDQATGKPEYVELVSGEKRLRSHLMFGRQRFDMHFTKNSTSATPTPLDEFQRQSLRLAENTKSTKPSDAEIFAGIRSLHKAHKLVDGEAAVAKLSVSELARRYMSALPTVESNTSEKKRGKKGTYRTLHRWIALACHSHSAAFLRIIKDTDCGVYYLDPVRTEADRKVAELGIELSPELIYALSIRADKIPFTLENVPEVLREKTEELLVKLQELEESDEEGNAIIEGLEGGRSAKSAKRAARAARESTAALRAYGVTAPKGNNGAPAREAAFTQLLLATVTLKGALDSTDAERFRRLNSLKGEATQDDKLTEYRLLMVEGHKALDDYRQRIAGSSHEINKLIDSLESSGDPLALIKRLQSNTDFSGSKTR